MNRVTKTQIPAVKAKLLEGKKGLVVGIANDQSIAWGCAKAFRAFGAELAVTYLNEKARKYVEPLARVLESPILMPLDVRETGQIEAVFERIARDWGHLDFVVHSIAFSPKETLQGRVVLLDLYPDGAFGGAADAQWRIAVHNDILWQSNGGEELQYHGGCQGGPGMRSALSSGRAWAERDQGSRDLARPFGYPSGLRNSRIRRVARQGQKKGARTEPRQHRRCRRRDCLSRP